MAICVLLGLLSISQPLILKNLLRFLHNSQFQQPNFYLDLFAQFVLVMGTEYICTCLNMYVKLEYVNLGLNFKPLSFLRFRSPLFFFFFRK